MLDWIFEGIVTWISAAATKLMDAVSGLFLNALGTDMTAMEEYFPFVSKAFNVMQYTAWAILFLIFVWQMFRVFGGPITESENPYILLARSAMFALLIGYAKSIFMIVLNIARAPYTALMDITMTAEDFTFAGIEESLKNGLTTIVANDTGVGLLLITILMIALGWNYFKLLLETVERYVVVGVLCYTSPLAYSLGGSHATSKVFGSWCRMIGSQLLLLVMNVWFLRAFDSSVGYFIGTGGTLTTGQGSIFLWLFCALAFLKTAQRFDSYLASLGLNVAQTGSSMGMELLMAARVIGGAAGLGGRTAGSVFKGAAGAAGSTATGTGAAATGFVSGFASRFKGNSYVRDAVVSGSSENMGAGGAVGFVGRTFGGIAARNGAKLTEESIASVATRPPNISGTIAGDIANRSLENYMPQMRGYQLKDTQISGGHITTKATDASGKISSVEMFNTAQYDKPEAPHSVVTAADGSTWYQMASGSGASAFYDMPTFTGSMEEAPQVAEAFPDAAEGTTLRSVDEGRLEATTPDGKNSLWYSSAFYDEPEAPHAVMQSSSGVDWYAMQPNASAPEFETLHDPAESNPFVFTDESTGAASASGTADIPRGDMPVQDIPAQGSPFYEGVQSGVDQMETPSYGDTPTETGQPSMPFYEGANPDVVQPAAAAYDGAPPESSQPSTPFYGSVQSDVIQPETPSYGDIPPEAGQASGAFYETASAAEAGSLGHSFHGEYPSGSNAPGASGTPFYDVPRHEAASSTDHESFTTVDAVNAYNRAQFQAFMPGYEQSVVSVDGSMRQDGQFEVRHDNGTGTRFYDTTRYAAPRGDHKVYEDARGGTWYAIRGEAAVERRPVYEDGKPVYDGKDVKTATVETVRYKSTPTRFYEPKHRKTAEIKPPKRKRP